MTHTCTGSATDGTFKDRLNVTAAAQAAEAGATGGSGTAGAGYYATSTTSLAIGTGSKTFTTQAGLAYSAGARARASSASDPTKFMEGVVTSYSGTTLIIDVDTVGGSGTYADWNINLAGEPATAGGTAATLDFDTDGTLSANSDARIPTQKATKTYVDQIIASQDAMVFKGVIDCSVNPNYPAADRGHTYRVSVAGKIGGSSGINVEAGDLLICLTDGTASGNQATVGASWTIAQANLDGAVIGPASTTDGGIVLFDGASGKLIKLGTLSQVLDLVGSPAQGDILYRDATGWTRLPAGTNGQYLKTAGAGANPAWNTIGVGDASAIKIDIYSTPGTFSWNKPAGARVVRAIAIGGGSSGTPGGRRSSGGGAYPAPGGAGGARVEQTFDASVLGSTETVVVGAGGAQAAGATGSDVAPGPGNAGSQSSFGTTPYLIGYGGGAGYSGMLFSSFGGGGAGLVSAGGNATSSAVGAAGAVGGASGGTTTTQDNAGSVGGAGSSAGTVNTVGPAAGRALAGGNSGGGGGNLTNSSAVTSAVAGGAPWPAVTGGAAGTSGSSPTDGGDGAAPVALGQCGAGGGGGGSSVTSGVNGRNGGKGGVGSGGGGGGHCYSTSTTKGGDGGKGGDGMVVVFTFF